MKQQPKKIGLAIVGAGRVGLIRAEVAARHPEVEWIGIAEKNTERARLVADRIKAELVASDFRELLKRPEVNAVRGLPSAVSHEQLEGRWLVFGRGTGRRNVLPAWMADTLAINYTRRCSIPKQMRIARSTSAIRSAGRWPILLKGRARSSVRI
jgi:hypothetical protein